MASSCSTRCPIETMPLRHELIDSLRLVKAKDWDALHDTRTPFVAHAFLDGTERHNCIPETWGWTPRHLTLWEGDRLLATTPRYTNANTHPQFVFTQHRPPTSAPSAPKTPPSSPPHPATPRTTRTGSSCSTTHGRTRMRATGRTTSPSSCARCPTRP